MLLKYKLCTPDDPTPAETEIDLPEGSLISVYTPSGVSVSRIPGEEGQLFLICVGVEPPVVEPEAPPVEPEAEESKPDPIIPSSKKK